MPLEIVVVDAFTDRPFGGNPAAVCVLPQVMPDAWMQRVAAEMKHSETAFLWNGDAGWKLRWFTPTIEVALCGHATLAAAHVLWESGREEGDAPITFDTQSGTLTALSRINSHGHRNITLDFPSDPPALEPAPPSLIAGIAADVLWTGKGRFDWLLELSDESAVRGLVPDMDAIAALDARGAIVTARSDASDYDFVSRYFAPGAGIPEDPVTGSAHCCLAPFWAERIGRTELVGKQLSSRGGTVGVRCRGDRVELSGVAVTVMHAQLTDAVARDAAELGRVRAW